MQDAPTIPVTRLLADAAWRVDAASAHALPAGVGMRAANADATLVYVLGGSATVRLDAGTTHAAAAGDLVLVLGGTARIRADGGADARLVVASIATVRGGAGLVGLPAAIAVRAFDAREPSIARLAADLGCHDDARVPSETDGIVCAHMATTILAAALRAWALCDAAARDWNARVGDPGLARVLDAIHDDPGRAWTVEGLATLGTMSRSAFAARFRDVVGTPPLRYLTEVRIAAAKRHLAGDGLSVAQTARMLGYASEDGFSRAFRRATGASPSTWRSGTTTAAAVVAVATEHA